VQLLFIGRSLWMLFWSTHALADLSIQRNDVPVISCHPVDLSLAGAGYDRLFRPHLPENPPASSVSHL